MQVLTNGLFYTVNESQPWAQAVAIDDNGILLAVGTESEVSERVGDTENVTTINLQGPLVLPGFQDVHLHAVEAGINANLCEIPEEAPIRKLSSYLKDCPSFADQGWIVGAGIDVGILLETLDMDFDAPYPVDVLDEHFPDTPILILDNLGHAAVCNTAALQQVGYDILTDDPPGGRVLKDENGVLLGIVTENAQQKLRDAAFPPTPANQKAAYDSLLDALQRLNRNGITSVSDAGGFWRQAQTEAWAQALENGKLTVRASNALYIYPDEPMETQLSKLLERYSNDTTSLLRFNQAKIYVDGILSLATAAVYEPYLASLGLDEDKQLGFEYFGDNLIPVAQTLTNEGFQLHFHVTGDRGAGLALDAIEASSPSASGGPHRLTHCYLVDERDRPRFQELGVVADFQLAPSSVQTGYQKFLQKDILGSERANTVLPAVEMYDSGAMLTLSSDWDADVLSPLLKLQTVLTRPTGQPFPNLETVIPMLTINGAKLLHQDDKTGSIEVGKFADLVVLDKNIFELPANNIAAAKVQMTFLGGQVVFDRATYDGPDDDYFGSGMGDRPRTWVAFMLALLCCQVCVR